MKSTAIKACSLFALLMALCAPPVLAHEGEDHAADDHAASPALGSAITEAATLTRLTLTSTNNEVVAVYRDHRLQFFVDDWASNTPLKNATLELDWQGYSVEVFHQKDGVYLSAPLPLPNAASLAGHAVPIVLSLSVGEQSDLLSGELMLPDNATVSTEKTGLHPGLPIWITLWLASLVLAVWIGRRWRGRSSALPLLLLIVFAPLASKTQAHGDETHAEAESLQTRLTGSTDKPQRLADGSYFVPKTVQHLLGVRTLVADFTQQAFSARLPATIEADVAAQSDIRAPVSAEILPAKNYPHAGQRVRRGDILLQWRAQFSAAERSGLQTALSKAELEARNAELRYQRTRSLQDALSARELEQITLERDRSAAEVRDLHRALQQVQKLIAPRDGVVAAIDIQPGARVEAGALLLTVLGEERSVVAYAPSDFRADAQVRARLQSGERSATLKYIGSARELRDQQLPLYFLLQDREQQFAIGETAQVYIDTPMQQKGVRIAASAVVRADDGSKAVFVKIGSEQFVLRSAQVQLLASGEVLLLQGVKGGERIVSAGASLLAQLR